MAILRGFELGQKQDLILNFGECAHILKDSLLVSSSFEINNECLTFKRMDGEIETMATSPEYRINLTFIGRYLETLTNHLNFRIRDKKVDNCSISELLFAVREKVKRNEIK